MDLSGKTALITGSAKGLGKSTAVMLASYGCNIILNYVTSEEAAKALEQQIRSMGVSCIALQADIADPEQAEQLADQAEEAFGGIDILINNAGPFIRERRVFSEYQRSEITGLLHGNLLGVMLLDHRVLPLMRSRNWGRIIHFGFGHAGEAESVATPGCLCCC